MKKILMSLVCLTMVLLGEEGRVLVAPNEKDAFSSEALWEQFRKDLNSSRIRLEKEIEKERALDLKKRESFKNGERLFCKNQIVSSKKGWSLDGDLLIKDDRYYSLADCFLKTN